MSDFKREHRMTNSEKKTNSLRETLAAYAHEAWAGWMRYLFDKSERLEDGSIVIPKWAAERWARQLGTHYRDLPEDEKPSDREEADKILAIVEGERAQDEAIARTNDEDERRFRAEVEARSGHVCNECLEEIDQGDIVLCESCRHEDMREVSQAVAGNGVDSMREKYGRLRAAARAVLDITIDSRGVDGLHLNGDVAEWDEFEEIAALESLLEEGLEE